MNPQSLPFASIASLVPDWPVSSRVTAFTTTRLGGVSQPPYEQLNLGLHVGDQQEHVLENRRLLNDAFALPDTPQWLKQTHTADVLELKGGMAIAPDVCADGSSTTQTDVVLAVLTADCLPVVISDKQGSQIAVVHAGWRGLAAGILENALSKFADNADLHVWLGPAIGAQAFEVGEEVKEAFVARHAGHGSAFAAEHSPGKFNADLYALARNELMNARALAVYGADYCTHSQANLFHSHRRDGVRSGRMATVAWISASPA